MMMMFHDAEPDRTSAKLDCADFSTAAPRSPYPGTILPCSCPPKTVQFSHTAIPAPHDGGIWLFSPRPSYSSGTKWSCWQRPYSCCTFVLICMLHVEMYLNHHCSPWRWTGLLQSEGVAFHCSPSRCGPQPLVRITACATWILFSE